MKKLRTRQQNYRMSAESIRVLTEVAALTGLTKTQVLEICVARHALSIPKLCDEARREIMQIVAAHLGEHTGKKR